MRPLAFICVAVTLERCEASPKKLPVVLMEDCEVMKPEAPVSAKVWFATVWGCVNVLGAEV